MFRFIDFQNNYFIATFFYFMFAIWKSFFPTRLNHIPEAFL